MSIPGINKIEGVDARLIEAINDRLRRIVIPKVEPPVVVAAAEEVQGNDVQLAYASGNLVLGASFADIPDATITLPLDGKYLVIGIFNFGGVGTDTNNYALGGLTINGSLQSEQAIFQPLVMAGAGITGSPVSFGGNVAQQWVYQGVEGDVLALQAFKSGGTGTSYAGTQTSISTVWIGP